MDSLLAEVGSHIIKLWSGFYLGLLILLCWPKLILWMMLVYFVHAWVGQTSIASTMPYPLSGWGGPNWCLLGSLIPTKSKLLLYLELLFTMIAWNHNTFFLFSLAADVKQKLADRCQAKVCSLTNPTFVLNFYLACCWCETKARRPLSRESL
jgi:hypothetical protein